MENQILELEKKYWKAMEDQDFETVKSLTSFPCIVAGKDGVRSIDEQTFQKMFESNKGSDMKVVNISGVETQTLNGNSAIIAYLIDFEGTMNGEKSSTKCVCTSTWIKDSNSWLCAMHTEGELEKK